MTEENEMDKLTKRVNYVFKELEKFIGTQNACFYIAGILVIKESYESQLAFIWDYCDEFDLDKDSIELIENNYLAIEHKATELGFSLFLNKQDFLEF